MRLSPGELATSKRILPGLQVYFVKIIIIVLNVADTKLQKIFYSTNI